MTCFFISGRDDSDRGQIHLAAGLKNPAGNF
jgi:hypothetical protein